MQVLKDPIIARCYRVTGAPFRRGPRGPRYGGDWFLAFGDVDDWDRLCLYVELEDQFGRLHECVLDEMGEDESEEDFVSGYIGRRGGLLRTAAWARRRIENTIYPPRTGRIMPSPAPRRSSIPWLNPDYVRPGDDGAVSA